MAATKLDGAGTQKMKTLEEALLTLTKIHGMIERAAIDVKAQKPMGVVPQQIKRVAVPMQGQLKGQFGMIADQVAGFILAMTRGGGGDQAKLRAMREGVAMIRQSVEFAVAKVKEQHSIAIEIAPD